MTTKSFEPNFSEVFEPPLGRPPRHRSFTAGQVDRLARKKTNRFQSWLQDVLPWQLRPTIPRQHRQPGEVLEVATSLVPGSTALTEHCDSGLCPSKLCSVINQLLSKTVQHGPEPTTGSCGS
jgi:hypothetical protein